MTNNQRKLFVDDLREAPDDTWTTVRTAWEALTVLQNNTFDVVSLDHDLASFVGNKELTGRDILTWLIQRKLDGMWTPSDIRVHSANPVGRQTMLEDIERYWTNK